MKAGVLNELNNEGGHKRGDLVTVEHMKLLALVEIVVHQTVSITVEAGAALSCFELADE